MMELGYSEEYVIREIIHAPFGKKNQEKKRKEQGPLGGGGGAAGSLNWSNDSYESKASSEFRKKL